MKPGDLVRHRHFIPSRIFMYIGPEIPTPNHGRIIGYRPEVVQVVEMGDPTFTKLRFHESYLKEIEE